MNNFNKIIFSILVYLMICIETYNRINLKQLNQNGYLVPIFLKKNMTYKCLWLNVKYVKKKKKKTIK